MVKALMRRAMRMAAAGAVLSQGALAEKAEPPGYELVSGHVDGRDVIVFVDGHGTAVAVELTEAGAAVLTGLAAGAALSDVEALEAADRPAFRLDRTSRGGAAALIDGMSGLSEAQREQLKSALQL